MINKLVWHGVVTVASLCALILIHPKVISNSRKKPDLMSFYSVDARVLRMYNREGVLQNTSEPVDQLEHVLDWRPSGNLIVSSQRLPHRHDIVFVERNGLRHGEFTLRESGEHRLLEVSWNADSTVLAVWLESGNQKSGMYAGLRLLDFCSSY